MKRTLFIPVAALLAALPLPACEAGTVAMPSQSAASLPGEHREEGREAVRALLDAYRSNFPGAFAELVSPDFSPDRLALINAAEEGGIGKTVLDLAFTVDRSILKGDTLAVTFDWTRTFIPSGSATQTMDSGTTTFVFEGEAGAWRLLRVNGDDIF